MYFIKKMSLLLLILLLFISIYKDLSTSTIPFYKRSNASHLSVHSQFTVIKVKVKHGDTVLSVIEELNSKKQAEINVAQLVADFTTLNPTVDPHNLKFNTYYYFPLY